jgi:hypothetical protein
MSGLSTRDSRAITIAELIRQGFHPLKVARAVRIATEDQDLDRAMRELQGTTDDAMGQKD